MDRLSAMQLLVDAVDAGSLSAVGRSRSMPLATVSRKIAELEAHLRTQILLRSNRRLALTDAGRVYVEACRRILEEVAEVERDASGEYLEPRGGLAISAPIMFGRMHLAPLLPEFLAAYPNIDVQLQFSDRFVDFLEDHIDLALRIGALADSELVVSRIGLTRRVICASPSYLEARGVPQTPDDLATHDCVTFDRFAAGADWVLRDHSIKVRSRLRVNTPDAAIGAAIAGVGLTQVFCYQVAAATNAGSLIRVLSAYEDHPQSISLIYPARGRLPMKLRAFLDFAKPRLRALQIGAV